MHEINFSDYCNDTTLCGIIEPLNEGDQVYIVSNDGKVYKWDNTVTTTTDKYLEHFKEVSVYDCPVFKSCSTKEESVSFTDIVEKEVAKNKIKYESTNDNAKTESFLLDYFAVKNRNIFPSKWEKVTMADNLGEIAAWIIKVNKPVAMQLIPDDYKDLSADDTQLAQVLTSALTLSLRDDKANREIAIIKAVKACCDNLKAAKESKKPSDKDSKKSSSKEEKKQTTDEEKKSDEA